MLSLEQARQWYQDADAVHDFEHVRRVYRLAERIARAEGADLEIVRAAALLHDAQGSDPGKQVRHNHHHASAKFAAQVLAGEGWSAERISAVLHCIRAHRFRGDESPQTLEAQVLFDADKLDVLGAIGVARAIAYATLAGMPWYFPPSAHFRETGEELPGEPHSAYHEYLFKLRRVPERLYTATARALAVERLRYLEEFFQRLSREWEGED